MQLSILQRIRFGTVLAINFKAVNVETVIEAIVTYVELQMPIAKMTLKRLKRTLLNLGSLHMLFF